uniref:Protein kinase domain-containing protein n=1 Tax=Oryza punctata TaxID=4537 RepID=A0A0E0JE53_ORYPU
MSDEQYEKIPYQALWRGTNGFTDTNLLGRGSYGAVYRCVFESGDKTLAVKIITCCSSIDLHDQGFKALVIEFMPNGSLDGWLHPKSQEITTSNIINFAQRLDIAVDIIDTVEYLHNNCQPMIIHCNLKPSNILLAEDMSARVGDFGISKYSRKCKQNAKFIYKLCVTAEYGEGSAVSTLGDIYSVGILLLEVFTGKSPTDDMFRDSLDPHKFTKDALPDRTLEIADSTVWLHVEPQDNIIQSRIQECLVCLPARHILLKATASRVSIDKRCSSRDACNKRCIPHVSQLAYNLT